MSDSVFRLSDRVFRMSDRVSRLSDRVSRSSDAHYGGPRSPRALFERRGAVFLRRVVDFYACTSSTIDSFSRGIFFGSCGAALTNLCVSEMSAQDDVIT